MKNLSKDHPEIASKQSNLANIYMNLGYYKEALALLESSLDKDLKNFGQDHPSIGICMNNIANVYYRLGNLNKAKKLWLVAYENHVRNFGENHPDTLYLKQASEINIPLKQSWIKIFFLKFKEALGLK